jgi:hypothetical protein
MKKKKITKDKLVRLITKRQEWKQRSFQYLLNNTRVIEKKKILLACIYIQSGQNKRYKTTIVNYCIISKNPR